MLINKEHYVRRKLLSMTGDEILALAKTETVINIVQSGIDNYTLFHELVIRNKQFPARELYKYSNINSLN